MLAPPRAAAQRPGGPARPVRSPGPLRSPLLRGASQIRIVSAVSGRATDTSYVDTYRLTRLAVADAASDGQRAPPRVG